MSVKSFITLATDVAGKADPYPKIRKRLPHSTDELQALPTNIRLILPKFAKLIFVSKAGAYP